MTLAMFLLYMCLITVWVLLPLIPAILIYRLFPQTPITATGVFSGLKINTGGAFAGYLVIFLALIPLINKIVLGIDSSYQRYWKVTGQVKFIDPHSQEPIKYAELMKRIGFTSRPKILDHDDHNEIYLRVLEEGGRPHRITIVVPEWGSAKIRLNEHLRSLKEKQSFAERIIGFMDQNDELDIGEIRITRKLQSRAYSEGADIDRPAP